MLDPGVVFQPPGLLRSREAITGARSLTANDNGLLLEATSGSGTIDADAATLGAGFKFTIYNSGSGSPVFDPTSTQTILMPTGSVSTVTILQGQGLTLVSDGTNWKGVLGIGFGGTPGTAVTVRDNVFTIQDDLDPTKQLQFQCASISAGTTRTLTAPDASITIAGINLAQTWTAAQNFGTGTTTIATADINGGNIDATAIGAASASTIAATTISASGQITSTVSTGTAPFVIASTTNVANLNASSLSGATFAAPGPIGSGTPSTGAFSTLTWTGGTSGRVPYLTTGGLFTNAATFTYDGSQMFLEGSGTINLSNDPGNGQTLYIRSTGNGAGSGNYQGMLAFGKADGSGLRTGAAIISVQGTADPDNIGLEIYVSPASSSSQTLQRAMLINYNRAVTVDTTLTVTGLATLNTGVAADGGGVKHSRVTTGSIGAGSTALVTVTWGTAFTDANYTVQASVLDSTTSSLSLSVVHIESITASAVTVRVLNNAAGSLTGTLHVIGVHD